MSKKYNFKKNANGETVIHDQGKKKFRFFAPLCCLLLAVFIWMYVAGSDPGITETYTVDLTMHGLDVMTDKMDAAPFFAEQVRVTVTLNGPDKVIKKIVPSQIKAYVDLSAIFATGVETLPVQVALDGVSPSVEIRDVSVKEVRVLIDSPAEKTIPVQVNLPLSAPDVVGHADPSTVVLNGPASVLDKLDLALVSLYGDFGTGQVFRNQNYVFLDHQGGTVSDPFLKCVRADVGSVNVRIDAKE